MAANFGIGFGILLPRSLFKILAIGVLFQLRKKALMLRFFVMLNFIFMILALTTQPLQAHVYDDWEFVDSEDPLDPEPVAISVSAVCAYSQLSDRPDRCRVSCRTREPFLEVICFQHNVQCPRDAHSPVRVNCSKSSCTYQGQTVCKNEI